MPTKAAESAADTKPAQSPKQWRPDAPCSYAPYRPGGWLNISNFLAYFFGYPGFLWPWTTIYFSVVVLTYNYAFPNLDQCKTFEFGWIAATALRNLVLLWIFAGGWHLLLYTLKLNNDDGSDGLYHKYDKEWPKYNPRKFMFGHQTYENVFMSCTSGVAIWTAYEVLFMHMWATGKLEGIVYYNWWENPVYSFGLIIATPFWREFHFYWIHRFSHWKPFYKRVHYLHHKNTNPGPWSGLSMHPIEHLLYFSVVIPHMFIPCHPIHLLFNSQHTALTPAGGHHGFEGPIVKGKIPTGSYFHYLHHRYFECNYGESTIPLDKWFGTFHDGLTAAQNKKISTKEGEANETQLTKYLTIAVGSALGLCPLVPFVSKALLH